MTVPDEFLSSISNLGEEWLEQHPSIQKTLKAFEEGHLTAKEL